MVVTVNACARRLGSPACSACLSAEENSQKMMGGIKSVAFSLPGGFGAPGASGKEPRHGADPRLLEGPAQEFCSQASVMSFVWV